jgi:hypothetical protein
MMLTLRSAFKASVSSASYLCEWASVRGALPQPLVVFSVITAALSTRARQGRLTTVIVTLLALRTLGEVIHGYQFGDEDGWDDDDDDDVAEEDETPIYKTLEEEQDQMRRTRKRRNGIE